MGDAGVQRRRRRRLLGKRDRLRLSPQDPDFVAVGSHLQGLRVPGSFIDRRGPTSKGRRPQLTADGGGVVLTGEKDIFGQAFNSTWTWAATAGAGWACSREQWCRELLALIADAHRAGPGVVPGS